MKKFFRVFLVGMILLGLSGVSAAEEWKQYNLPEVVQLKLSAPATFKSMGQDQKNGDGFLSAFMDEDRGLILMVFKEASVLEASKDFKTDYGMDELTSAEENDFIKKFTRKGETGKFITLDNGHRALLIDVNRAGAYGKMIIVLKKGYVLGITVLKEDGMNRTDLKLTNEIFQKSVF